MNLIDPLDPDKITANLNTKRIGGEVIVYDSTSSTNDIAGEYSNGTGNDGLVIFAEEQISGRGRGGNQWFSGRGASVLCSVLLMGLDCGAELLSLACAVAVAEAIGKAGPVEAKIKWPNDVWLGGRKVAGILLESRAADKSVAHIIGVGINCHQGIESFSPELRDIATSIDMESESRCD
ncbi:MAG: biotin--[acetyl-CoA-carboxylase] ligase, partial [Planctomycetota bacterium]